jgi:glutamate formiminotransferase
VLACVVNVSEGRDEAVVGALAAAAGGSLLDVHCDADHHRSVLTLAGHDVEEAARAVARTAVERIDLRAHRGAHPRLGSVDVVPFVPLDEAGSPAHGAEMLGPALEARGRFAEWAATALALPCFFYGPERTLPEVRRHAFATLAPDRGPGRPHPAAGACAVGARGPLVAYNVWLDSADVSPARAVARAVRSPAVRALGLAVGGRTQVSMNLVDPLRVGPLEVYDAVSRLARAAGVTVVGAELVGLAPAAVVDAVPSGRLGELDLDRSRTIEARLARGPTP